MSGAAAMTSAFPLEEFQILGPIGRGEFGKVHRAAWTTTHVDVALKHIEAAQAQAQGVEPNGNGGAVEAPAPDAPADE